MKTKYIHLISALALLSVSCQQGSEEQLLSSSGEMSFNIIAPNGGTRVADGAFEAGDKIGVYVTDYTDATTSAPLQISGNRANNEAMSYDGAKWVAERPIYWGDSKADVYAYYPYMDIIDVDEQPFSVALDQDVEDCYESSDFLWAKAAGVAQVDEKVELEFKHRCSKLVVKLVKGADYSGVLPTASELYIHSTIPTATIDFTTGAVTKYLYGEMETIKAKRVDDGTFEAIIIPQRLETRRPFLEYIANGVSYLYEGTFIFKAGKQHTLELTIDTNPDQIEVEVGGEVGGW